MDSKAVEKMNAFVPRKDWWIVAIAGFLWFCFQFGNAVRTDLGDSGFAYRAWPSIAFGLLLAVRRFRQWRDPYDAWRLQHLRRVAAFNRLVDLWGMYLDGVRLRMRDPIPNEHAVRGVLLEIRGGLDGSWHEYELCLRLRDLRAAMRGVSRNRPAGGHLFRCAQQTDALLCDLILTVREFTPALSVSVESDQPDNVRYLFDRPAPPSPSADLPLPPSRFDAAIEEVHSSVTR